MHLLHSVLGKLFDFLRAKRCHSPSVQRFRHRLGRELRQCVGTEKAQGSAFLLRRTYDTDIGRPELFRNSDPRRIVNMRAVEQRVAGSFDIDVVSEPSLSALLHWVRILRYFKHQTMSYIESRELRGVLRICRGTRLRDQTHIKSQDAHLVGNKVRCSSICVQYLD